MKVINSVLFFCWYVVPAPFSRCEEINVLEEVAAHVWIQDLGKGFVMEVYGTEVPPIGSRGKSPVRVWGTAGDIL